MNLRDLAVADLAVTLESPADFGVPVIVTDPAGNCETFQGQTGLIGAVIDPQLGTFVSGDLPHVVLSIASLDVAGFCLPEGEADPDSDPWILEFDGQEYTVDVSMPDHTLGIVTLVLGRLES